ncbi:uncharacterized protein [Phyllobates terribilis]|uniref:uncharacterized protein n=1 Tax=Phyllobates terribilis TaxID=111132 RepID=UPI003CCAC52B
MASREGKSVCVTGGSGYIASWLVKHLLDRGYTVRATVRNLNDEKKFKHLLELDGAKERLQLFEADLLKESSFDSAIDGCIGVFHPASPCYLDCKDPQAELIDPAVKGTINVLTSCAKSPSLKRVIFTSTAGTMMFRRTTHNPENTMADETWFSDPELCRENKQWYVVSKILAEEAAWKFVKAKGIDMVVINPGLTVGHLLQPTLNFSSGVIASLVNNATNAYPNSRTVWVHIQDVVRAHILAFEDPSASGRYAVVESRTHFSEVLSMIRELYPTLPLPDQCFVNGEFPDAVQISKEKTKSLGIDSYVPLKAGLKETIESLREKKFIEF